MRPKVLPWTKRKLCNWKCKGTYQSLGPINRYHYSIKCAVLVSNTRGSLVDWPIYTTGIGTFLYNLISSGRIQSFSAVHVIGSAVFFIPPGTHPFWLGEFWREKFCWHYTRDQQWESNLRSFDLDSSAQSTWPNVPIQYREPKGPPYW